MITKEIADKYGMSFISDFSGKSIPVFDTKEHARQYIDKYLFSAKTEIKETYGGYEIKIMLTYSIPNTEIDNDI